MSLVGTRPPTLQEFEMYSLHHRVRMTTKPGITGMWQVSGRSEITDFEEVVKLDKEYIENWSLGDYYGQVLKEGNTDFGIIFHLKRRSKLTEIEEAIDSALDYHERFGKRGVKLKEEYTETEPIFEISHYPYTETLSEQQNFVKAANSNYLVLTGSAGNGKTNLLCSIAELTEKLKQPVLLLNSRDIDKDIDDYILDCLRTPAIWRKHKELYYWFVNATLKLRGKHLFILIDAVNENDNPKFGEQLSSFINDKDRYHRFKIITSCRSEYYKDRFSKHLSDSIEQKHLIYDLRDGKYPNAAVQRIIKRYRNHFKYTGYMSSAVTHVICQHLLLLRIFFEVNEGSNEDILSIRKHEIFSEYIKWVKESKNSNIEEVLDTIADAMMTRMSFDDLEIDYISKFQNEDLQKAFDETILLSKKLVSHKGTIANMESEYVYFVFDEMRDYCIARYIMKRNSTPISVNCDGIISDLMRLREAQVSCEEGVIQYAYVFFKTDTLLSEEERKLYCKKILDFYRIEEGHKAQYYRTRHRVEFLNYGLKVLFATGFPLEEFEKDYICECLRICPNEDGGKLFDTTLEGTVVGLPNNLNLYFDILFGLGDIKIIVGAYKQMIARTYDDSLRLPYDLIKYHKAVCENYPDRAMQIQKAAELFILLFEIDGLDKEDSEMICYFESLPEHDRLKEEMRQDILSTINEEQ